MMSMLLIRPKWAPLLALIRLRTEISRLAWNGAENNLKACQFLPLKSLPSRIRTRNWGNDDEDISSWAILVNICNVYSNELYCSFYLNKLSTCELKIIIIWKLLLTSLTLTKKWFSFSKDFWKLRKMTLIDNLEILFETVINKDTTQSWFLSEIIF